MPRNLEDVLKEFGNLPSCVPVGKGEFQGLKCPSCLEERFVCKACIRSFIREVWKSALVYGAHEILEMDVIKDPTEDSQKCMNAGTISSSSILLSLAEGDKK